MTNREKIMHDCNTAADELLAREAMARYRQAQRRDRDERNVRALAFATSIISIIIMLAVAWMLTGGGK